MGRVEATEKVADENRTNPICNNTISCNIREGVQTPGVHIPASFLKPCYSYGTAYATISIFHQHGIPARAGIKHPTSCLHQAPAPGAILLPYGRILHDAHDSASVATSVVNSRVTTALQYGTVP